MQDRISINITGGVADVRLNRPDKMNAIDDAMFEALAACGQTLAKTSGLRAVVLSGEGRAFCAGLDMGSFAKMADGSDTLAAGLHLRTHGTGNIAQHAAMLWRNLPVPVIAAAHGVAFGGGLQIMLGAEIRLVTPDMRLSVMEVKWGLVPDMAGLALMRLTVRDDIVRELTYTGRQFSGEEALSLGIATRVSANPREEALELARHISAQSPDAIRAAKRLLNLAVEGDEQAVLLAESLEQQALVGSANQIEAVRAGLDRRPAQFTDPDPARA